MLRVCFETFSERLVVAHCLIAYVARCILLPVLFFLLFLFLRLSHL